MAYKALYRSYRPNSFGTVIGQEHIIKTLKNALLTNKTSHAYIFSGPRGIGKTTIARILAKAINCEDLQNGEPCNKCAACRLINNNETPDIIELDAASNNGVDEIRAVLEKVNFLPGVLKNKVYIIDEVHMLSISAFNALLKTLEEPPVHVMFILATTEPHKIPATILSRCQRFDFKPLTVKEIKKNLKNIAEKEKIAIEEEALNLVAEASEGGMRDAIGILDQVSAYSTTDITIDDVNNVTGRISNQKLIELMQAINDSSSAKAVDLTNDLLSIGKEPSRLVQSLLQLCRDILLYQTTDGEVNDKVIYDDVAFKMLTNSINKKKVFCYIDILSDIQNKIKYSLSQKIFLEVGIMKMANTTKDEYESQIVVDGNGGGAILSVESEERISNLEAHLNKLKSELVKLNLNEFKEETKAKLNSLEDLSNKVMFGNISDDIEERLTNLEAQMSIPENNDLNNVKEEINIIKTQISANNNVELPSDLLEKISVLEKNSENINIRVEGLENKPNDVSKEQIETLENSIRLALNQLEELANKVDDQKEESRELTLFDFDNGSKEKEEINELKSLVETLQEEINNIKNTYAHVSDVLDELILTKTVEQPIQKRQNPYEEKVQDIVESQRALEEIVSIETVQKEKIEIVTTEEVAPKNVIETVEKEILEEHQEKVIENNKEVLEVASKEEIIDKEEPTIELPEEMTRSIDDLFNNPVFFNKPLEDSVEIPEEKVAEKPKPIEPKPVVVKEEPKNKIPTIEDFERIVEEEKHYDLSCNIKQLENNLRKMATLKEIPFDVLNYTVVDLFGMREDIQMFIKDKNDGVYLEDKLLEKDANRNIKTFLITISVRDAMVAATKDKEVRKLIEEIKALIKEFRNVKTETLVETKTPLEIVVEKPVEQKAEIPVQHLPKEAVIQQETIEINSEQEVVASIEEEKIELPVQHLPKEIVEEEQQEENVIEKEEMPVEEKTVGENIDQGVIAEEVKQNFQLEELVIKEETPKVETKVVEPTYKRATVLETKPKRETYKDIPNDNPYAIEKIEMVMHDSRSEISREERKIILNNWRRLADRVGTGLLPVAKFLMDGTPVVNGNNCIIITYPSAALCNHIMGDKIRFEAKQILKITFGREYDFVALPDNIWQEKRNEYRGQYQMGTRYPKLTPINNPELRIIKKSFVDEKNASYNKAVDLFGENLIREEE